MDTSAFLERKEIQIVTMKGENRTFIISKFPSMQGREIVAGYPLTGMPKFGDYKANEGIMMKLMAFVGVHTGQVTVALTTPELINNHTSDWETLAKIEYEMLRYNTSFLDQESLSRFLKDTITTRLISFIPTLKASLQQLLTKEKQATTN